MRDDRPEPDKFFIFHYHGYYPGGGTNDLKCVVTGIHSVKRELTAFVDECVKGYNGDRTMDVMNTEGEVVIQIFTDYIVRGSWPDDEDQQKLIKRFFRDSPTGTLGTQKDYSEIIEIIEGL